MSLPPANVPSKWSPAVAPGRVRAVLVPLWALFLVVACTPTGGDLAGPTGTRGGAVAQLAVVAGGGGSVEVGEAVPGGVTVRATNALGAPVAGVLLTASGDGEVAPQASTTESDGRAVFTWTPATVGTQTLRVAAGPKTATASVKVRPLARVVRERVTTTLTGAVGEPLEDSVRVEVVRARDAAPQAGVAVRFVVASGGGSVSVGERVTDARGQAAVRWTLGAVPGEQILRAEVEATTGATATSAMLSAVALPPALSGFSVNPSVLTLVEGTTQALAPQPVLASGSVGVTYAWSTSSAAVATVSGGVVTAVAPGTATIRVVATGSGGGYARSTREATVAVTVAPPPTGRGFGAGEFALIPAGTFGMGSTEGFWDEGPVRPVTLSAFRLQRTEVTQAQWRQVMAGTPLANPSYFTSCGDTCPVESVSWADIQEFLTRLNQQDPGKGYRLPTEAEWEYAARAGTTGDYGIAGAVCSFAWISDSNCSQWRTWPVAQKPANAWGLHDMHGNVLEWVQDWYGPYPSTPQTNPTGPATGSDRVLRGGCWIYGEGAARSAIRIRTSPADRFNCAGLRLARTP